MQFLAKNKKLLEPGFLQEKFCNFYIQLQREHKFSCSIIRGIYSLGHKTPLLLQKRLKRYNFCLF